MQSLELLFEKDIIQDTVVVSSKGEILLYSNSILEVLELNSNDNILDKLDIDVQHNNGSFKINDEEFNYTIIQEDTDRYLIVFESFLNTTGCKVVKLLQKAIDMTAIVSVTDHKGIITHVNEKFVEISGYSRDELIGSFQNIVNSGHHNKEFWKNMWRTILKGEIWQGDILNKTKDGSLYWVDTTIMPSINSDHKMEYISIRKDITVEKNSIIELEKKAMFYEESKRLSKVGYWEILLDSGKLYWDDVVKEIHEVPIDFEPNINEAINFYDGEAKNIITGIVNDGIENGANWDIQLPLITAKNNKIWVRAIGKVILNEDGTPKRIYGVFKDETEERSKQKKHFERELLYKEMEVKENFFSNMSHEIRTPVNAMLGIIDTLNLTDLNEEQKELIEILNESGNNLVTILNNVLDLSKIKKGKLNVNAENFDIIETVFQNIKGLQSLALRKELYLKFDTDIESLDCYSDKTKIIQILNNLISNAIKFTKEGGITVKVSTIEHYVNIDVIDTGIGITESALELIFNEYEQLDHEGNSQVKGTGLGLAISRKISGLIGGSIKVESIINEGSTFSLKIPISYQEKEVKLAKETSSHLQYNVIVADDIETNRKVASAMLKKLEIPHILCTNGQETIDALENNDISHILMDIQMPEMDGITATKIIRNKGHNNVEIIALTGKAISEFDYHEFGFNDYILKPIRFGYLENIFE